MATLKNMTRVGADVRQIARLLQAKAPENHMLAYITPEEAQLLKDRGGSGMPDPETGIPSFQEENFSYDMYGESASPNYTTIYETNQPEFPIPEFSAGQPAASFDPYQFVPARSAVEPVSAQPVSTNAFSGEKVYPNFFSLDTSPGSYNRFVEAQGGKPIDTSRGFDGSTKIDTAVTPSVGDRFRDLSKSLGVKEDTLARMGLGGLQALLGARQARLAKEEAQKAKEEQQKIAAPYQTKGAELQRQAQAGELTPVARQQMQAVQAQAAQSASARGGVGAQQTAARVEALRGQLLQQQYDYGLKLSGIGDQLALGAIRTGLEADRYVNQLSNTYYTNIARTLVGAPTVVQYGVTQ